MQRPSNYDLTREQMEGAFVRYDQGEMIRKFHLRQTSEHLFITFIGEDYRIGRRTGKVERLPSGGGAPVPAGFNESMTLFDVLCSSKPDCRLSGEYMTVTNLPGIANIAAPGTGTPAFSPDGPASCAAPARPWAGCPRGWGTCPASSRFSTSCRSWSSSGTRTRSSTPCSRSCGTGIPRTSCTLRLRSMPRDICSGG